MTTPATNITSNQPTHRPVPSRRSRWRCSSRAFALGLLHHFALPAAAARAAPAPVGAAAGPAPTLARRPRALLLACFACVCINVRSVSPSVRQSAAGSARMPRIRTCGHGVGGPRVVVLVRQEGEAVRLSCRVGWWCSVCDAVSGGKQARPSSGATKIPGPSQEEAAAGKASKPQQQHPAKTTRRARTMVLLWCVWSWPLVPRPLCVLDRRDC